MYPNNVRTQVTPADLDPTPSATGICCYIQPAGGIEEPVELIQELQSKCLILNFRACDDAELLCRQHAR
jgi:hypothetical protein